MTQPVSNYDEISDTLYISFAPGEQATGIELTPHILLRLNKQEHKAIGLTFLEYSLLAQKTDMGPPKFSAHRSNRIVRRSSRHCLRYSSTSTRQRCTFAFIVYAFNFRNDSDYAAASSLLKIYP